MADSAFAERGIGAEPPVVMTTGASSALKQIVGVIQPGAENGRGAARIFSRAEDDDRIGGMNFLQAGFVHDLKASDPEKDANAAAASATTHKGQGLCAAPACGLAFILARKTRRSPGPEWRLRA